MFRLLALALLLLEFVPSVNAQSLEIKRPQGEASFVIENSAVTDLSGITWTGGDTFATVSDKRNVLQFVTLKINRVTGEIVTGSFGETREVAAGAHDFEGLTWVAATKAFYICAEEGPSVIRLPPLAPARSLPLPDVFARARLNLSLESLTWSDKAQQFWIANEEALRTDGPLSNGETGTLVRVQKLDAKFRPLAQYPWRTEPARFRYGNAGSGVSDLCLLPEGQLIVLERGFAEAGLQLRLFLADFTKATDVSRMASLEKVNLVPGKKNVALSRVNRVY
jgi:hypothetical protein